MIDSYVEAYDINQFCASSERVITIPNQDEEFMKSGLKRSIEVLDPADLFEQRLKSSPVQAHVTILLV